MSDASRTPVGLFGTPGRFLAGIIRSYGKCSCADGRRGIVPLALAALIKYLSSSFAAVGRTVILPTAASLMLPRGGASNASYSIIRRWDYRLDHFDLNNRHQGNDQYA